VAVSGEDRGKVAAAVPATDSVAAGGKTRTAGERPAAAVPSAPPPFELPGLWESGDDDGATDAAQLRFANHLLAFLPAACQRVLLLTPHPALAAALRARGCEVVDGRDVGRAAEQTPGPIADDAITAAAVRPRGGSAPPVDAGSAADGGTFPAAAAVVPEGATLAADAALLVIGPAGPAPLGPLLETLRGLLVEKGRLVVAAPIAPGGPREEGPVPVVALSEAGYVILKQEPLAAYRGPARCGDTELREPVPSAASNYELLVARRDDGYRVREYRPGDEVQILPIFEGSFFVRRTLERWSWEYRENPHGNLLVSEAFDETGQLVAHYAGYPVRFRDRGEPLALPAVQVGDTFTLPAVRHVGRGPTSLLGRTVRHFYARFCHDRVAFNYGFNTGNIQRFSMAFVGARRLEDIPFLTLALPGRAPAPPAARERLLGGWSAGRVAGFDARWDAFRERVEDRYGLLVERDARYLDWRYTRCPDGEYLATAAWHRGELAGWGVFRRRDDRLLWGDALVDPEQPRAARLVLAAALAQPEHRGVTQVETWGSPRPAWWRAWLLELGFEPRPEPAGLGIVFVPFAVDPEAAFRDRLYYSMGDSDLF
jgi:hypothetical protein